MANEFIFYMDNEAIDELIAKLTLLKQQPDKAVHFDDEAGRHVEFQHEDSIPASGAVS